MTSSVAQVVLASKGIASKAFQLSADDPEASTSFRRLFHRYTAFVVETLAADALNITSGSTTVTQEVPRVGDVVYHAYLSVAVPGLANVALFATGTSGTADMAQDQDSFYAEILPNSAQMLRYKASVANTSGYAVVDGATLNSGASHSSVFFPYWLSPRWVPVIAMISSIKMIVGNTEVDELTTVILAIWKELGSNFAQWSHVEGDWDYAIDAINASKTMQLYFLDLPFAFFLAPPDKEASNSISLITLSFHKVQFAVSARALANMIVGYASDSTTPFKQNNAANDGDVSLNCKTVVRNGQSVSTAISATTGLTNGTLAYYNTDQQDAPSVAFSDVSWQFLYSYAYLSEQERLLYSDISYETVITCWDYTTETYSNTSTTSMNIEFNHPTAAIIVVAQSKHHQLASATLGGAVVSANETQYRNDYLDFSGITEYTTLEKRAPFLGVSIELNSLKLNSGGFNTVGNNMIPEQYYRKLMLRQNAHSSPYKPWADLKDGRQFIYVFSFAISPFGPDPLQPQGFANLAKIDNVKVKFHLDDQLFANNSAKGNENLTGNTVDVTIVGFTYNVFRYISGLGGKGLL